MGKRGPPKTPTKVLKERGVRTDHRKDEPQPKAAPPPQPEHLDDTERDVWQQVTAALESMGTLAETDGNAIARYCTLLVDWHKCTDYIKKNGLTYAIGTQTGGSCYQQYPEVGIRNKLTADLLRLEQQFGLTPAARASIHIDPSKNKPATRSRKR